jgi:hypothetical protein
MVSRRRSTAVSTKCSALGSANYNRKGSLRSTGERTISGIFPESGSSWRAKAGERKRTEGIFRQRSVCDNLGGATCWSGSDRGAESNNEELDSGIKSDFANRAGSDRIDGEDCKGRLRVRVGRERQFQGEGLGGIGAETPGVGSVRDGDSAIVRIGGQDCQERYGSEAAITIHTQ